MVYAQILNGIISNIIELDDSSLIPLFSQGFDSCLQIDNLSIVPSIGWYYDIPSSSFYPAATLALIQNNLVVNVIKNCDAYITANSSNYQYIVDVTLVSPIPMIGWGYDGTNFTPSQAYYQAVVNGAMSFGQSIIIQAAARNISMGITQVNLTIPVMEYCSALITSLFTGSLYAAITQLTAMIVDTSTTKASLAPFVNNDTLYSTLNQIQTYLGIPLTPNPGD